MELTWLNGYSLLLAFFPVATIIIFSTTVLSKSMVVFQKKTKVSGAILGVILLGMVTSLPELMTSVTAGIIESPELSIANIWGANMMTVVTLVIVDIIFWKNGFISKTNKTNISIVYMLLIINFVFLIIFATGLSVVSIGGISITSILLLIFIGYVLYAVRSGEEEDDEDEDEIPDWTLKTATIFFVISAVIVVIASIFLANIANKISLPVESGGLGWGITVAGAVLLSFATTLPEITATIKLSKMSAFNLAIAGIVGSHLINFAGIAITDFSSSAPIINEVHNAIGESSTLLMTIIFGSIITLLLLLIMKMSKFTNKYRKYILHFTVILLYIGLMIYSINMI